MKAMSKSTKLALLVLAIPIGIALYTHRKNLKARGPAL
jgi:hypothetical protein